MKTLGFPDYLIDLQLSSLDQRMEDLGKKEEDIKQSFHKEEVIVTLHPESLPSGQVSVRELTLILGGLQDLTDSIANSMNNNKNERGKIPSRILDENTFILKETRAGSFKAVLEMSHSLQESFEKQPEQTRTIEELFTLLNSSDKENELTEIVTSLGSRTIKNYQNFSKAILDLNTSLDFDWISPKESYKKSSISKETARQVYNLLSKFSATEESIETVQGRLTGANIRTKSFEIISNLGERISGKINKDVLSKVAVLDLNQDYSATLMKQTVHYTNSKKVKVTWLLNDIKNKK